MRLLNRNQLKKYLLHLHWFVFLYSTFFVALALSWMLLASVNFAYPLLYDHAGIAENIVEYAPKNPIKPYFNHASRTEHIRLFAGIVEGIHQQGEGLAALSYRTHTGQVMTLLTQDELLHLQDVADFYDKMKWAVWGGLLVWLMLFVIQQRWRLDVSAIKFLPYFFVLFAIVGMVIMIGAEKIFYYLHTVVFPANHQWFFYYEESLMSMMMKAPDLFAYIAVMLVFLALFFSMVMLGFYKYYARMKVASKREWLN